MVFHVIRIFSLSIFPCLSLQYAIVIDAGSTHTEMYLYVWELPFVYQTGIVHQKTECQVSGVQTLLNENTIYLFISQVVVLVVIFIIQVLLVYLLIIVSKDC